MRPPASLHESRAYSPENFSSSMQNAFCNKIGTTRTSQHVCAMSAFELPPSPSTPSPASEIECCVDRLRPPGQSGHASTGVGRSPNDRFCCKSRKLRDDQFFAKTGREKQPPIRLTAVALPKSPVSLTYGDEVLASLHENRAYGPQTF